MASTIESINDIKITQEEIDANGVSALRDAPNRHGGFGTNGLTAEELKNRFDKLPKLIAKRLNTLIDYILSDDIADEIKIDALDNRIKDLETGFDGALDEIIRLQDYYTGKTFDELHAYAVKLINGGAEDVS